MFFGVTVIPSFLTIQGISVPNLCVVQASVVFYSLYAIVNGIAVFSSLSDNQLLVYENIAEFCLLICTLLHCLLDFQLYQFFICRFFCIQDCVIFEQFYIFSNLDALNFLWGVESNNSGQNFSVVLINSDKYEYLYLIRDPRGNQSFIIEYTVSCGIFINILYHIEEFTLSVFQEFLL